MADDNIEHVHCSIEKVFVFEIPKVSSVSNGYSARDWPKQAVWTGRLRVVSKGDKCNILLEHSEEGKGVYLKCPYTNKTVVSAVVDSSRYFVLRVEDQGRKALVGLGFKTRSQAFEFNVGLQEFDNLQTKDKRAEEYLSSLPSKDYSIPEGGSITVSVPIVKKPPEGGEKKKKKKTKAAVALPEEGGGLKLQPPPEVKTRQPAIKKPVSPGSSGPASAGGSAGASQPKPAPAASKPGPGSASGAGVEQDLFGFGGLSVGGQAPAKAQQASANPFDELF